MARGLWAAFAIVVGVVSFAVVALSEPVMARALTLLFGIAPGGLQLGAYGTLALAATTFAVAIFLFLIVVPELTDIARLDGVLRSLRGLHPLHEGSPKSLLRALSTTPLLADTAALLTPSLRLQEASTQGEAILVSDNDGYPLVAPATLGDTPPRVRFFRAVVALLALAGVTLALLNTAAPQTTFALAEGGASDAIGTVALLAFPLAVAILLWAGQELLRDITRLQLRQVQDELRVLIAISRPASDGLALRDTLREEMTKLQQGLADFLEIVVRRIDAIPAPQADAHAAFGELPQIAGALKELREELTATVQVARDATKLLFSSAQHIEDIANLMREGGPRLPASPLPPAASVAPTQGAMDEATGDLRRAIGELLAETEQAERLPKF